MGGEEQLMTEAQAAKYINVSIRTLVRWRLEGVGPPVLWARRSPRYRKRNIDEWMQRRAEDEP
jgi:predicted site-specific integrase-resolvase